MFVYNDKEYNNVWFTSDEHYNSGRHLSLSCRLGFDDLSNDKRFDEYKRELEKTNIPPVLQHSMLVIARNSVYGMMADQSLSNIEKMNNKFIENHNERVGDNDIVFHIGDFGDYEYAKYLNGTHVLLMGNYEHKECDEQHEGSIENFRKKILESYNFIDVITNYMLELTDNNNKNGIQFPHYLRDRVNKIFMTHQPTHCLYDHENKCYIKTDDDKITMNLFGHIHEKCKIKRFGVNVGIDNHHYYPMSIEEVVFYLYAIIRYYDEDVFC